MKKEQYYTPFYIVCTSVVISILIYLLLFSFLIEEEFYTGLIKSIVYPISIALPISLFTTKYHKKIYRQKKELEQINELNNKLISIIAHDVRSPLSIIKGFVEIIHEDISNNETAKTKDKLNSISNRVDNLLLFLNDLLKWSRNQIQLAPINITSFNPKKCFEKIVDTYQTIQQEKNITTSISTNVTDMLSDKEIYSFIIRNLYHNSLKFSQKNGKISIDLHETESKTVTTVSDNGIGISDENLEKIKDNNQWFSTSGTANEKGTGLGIKTIIQYLKICNGELLIESIQNKGTSITVTIPKKKF